MPPTVPETSVSETTDMKATVIRTTTPPVSPLEQHVAVLDPLRGFAAAAVCFFHIAAANQGKTFLHLDDPVRWLATFGKFGVQIFFVISGFVLPYSLFQRAYRVADAPAFLVRRMKRLEPPYLASIGLVLILNCLSALAPGYRGNPFVINWPQLFAHIGYLNSIVNLGWLNPAFWTLAIELQFYLFLAAAYPLLVHRSAVVRGGFLALLSLSSVIFHFAGLGPSLLPHWLPLFAMGMAAFQRFAGLITPTACLAQLALATCLSTILMEAPATVASVATAWIIIMVRGARVPALLRPLTWLGTISYSLYLVHAPIGQRMVNLTSRLSDSVPLRYAVILVAFGTCVAFATVFWTLVERPAQVWAKRPGFLPLFPKGSKSPSAVTIDVFPAVLPQAGVEAVIPPETPLSGSAGS